MKFDDIKVGDKVTRMLAGVVPMELNVSGLTDDRIICGPWEFDRSTGVEIDEDIACTVSHLLPPNAKVSGAGTASAGLPG